MSSSALGGGLGAFDSIFNPGRAHQIEEETRQMILPLVVDAPGPGPKDTVRVDLDAGIAVIRIKKATQPGPNSD